MEGNASKLILPAEQGELKTKGRERKGKESADGVDVRKDGD
jgi:hypothetical protein